MNLPPDIKSIINYLRRSRQDEERERRTGEDTLAEQKMLMNRVLSTCGIPYEQRFEIGSGDKIETRPVFSEVLEELQAGKWNAIAVKEISRLGRGSYTDMGRIYDILTSNRIYIITPYKIYDPKNHSDLRQIRFELFLSREEFETTRERLMGARYNYSLQGKWMAGSVPFGYRFDEHTQRLMIEVDQAEVVRLIFHLYTHEKMGYQAIATHLRKIGIRTATGKARWQPEVVHRMLKKPVYIGQVNFRTTERQGSRVKARPQEEWIIVEAAHEPIIDEQTWEQAQRRLRDTAGKLPINTDYSPCELASLVVCRSCARKMVRQYSVQQYTKRDGSISTYEKEFLRCTCGVYVKYREVEERLLELIGQIKLDPTLLEAGVQAILQAQPAEESVQATRLTEQLAQQEDSIQRKLEKAYELVLDGTFTKEEFAERRAKYQAEIDEINEHRHYVALHHAPERSSATVDLSDLLTNLVNVHDVYQKLGSKTGKNRLFQAVFDQVELAVREKGRGRKPTTFDLYIRFKAGLLV